LRLKVEENTDDGFWGGLYSSQGDDDTERVRELLATDEKIRERPGRAPRILLETNASFRRYIRATLEEDNEDYPEVTRLLQEKGELHSPDSTPRQPSPEIPSLPSEQESPRSLPDAPTITQQQLEEIEVEVRERERTVRFSEARTSSEETERRVEAAARAGARKERIGLWSDKQREVFTQGYISDVGDVPEDDDSLLFWFDSLTPERVQSFLDQAW
jgi:hypothetical protein